MQEKLENVSSILPKNEQNKLTKLLWYLKSNGFCSFFFLKNWRHQKDISKLTDLYFEKNFNPLCTKCKESLITNCIGQYTYQTRRLGDQSGYRSHSFFTRTFWCESTTYNVNCNCGIFRCVKQNICSLSCQSAVKVNFDLRNIIFFRII